MLYVSDVITTQAPLAGPVAVAVGLAALGIVVIDAGWQVIRHGMVMAHEGAHAVADAVLGRQVHHIELHRNGSGETYPRNQGGCLARVITAFVGYIGPSLFGLGAAKLIQLGYIVAVLWVTLSLLVLLLLLLHWSFGLITVTLASGLVYLIVGYIPVPTETVAAYAIAWLLLLSGVRGLLASDPRRGDSQTLSQLTLIPRICWAFLWLTATLAAVAVGGSWLVMRA